MYLVTLNATSGKLVLIASSTVNFLFTWDEALRANGILADNATEALLVPLPGLVLHLLGTCKCNYRKHMNKQ